MNHLVEYYLDRTEDFIRYHSKALLGLLILIIFTLLFINKPSKQHDIYLVSPEQLSCYKTVMVIQDEMIKVSNEGDELNGDMNEINNEAADYEVVLKKYKKKFKVVSNKWQLLGKELSKYKCIHKDDEFINDLYEKNKRLIFE